MVVSIPEFDVESLAVSRDSVTHAVPDDRERTPTRMAIVGSGRANGVTAT